MKYVVFELGATGLKMPVIFPDHVTHSQIKIEGASPVSAGFCFVGTEELVTIGTDRSESLNLMPMAGDRELIMAILCNAGMYAFMGLTQ